MMLMIKGSTLPHLIQVTDLDLLAMFKVLVPNFITVITWLFYPGKEQLHYFFETYIL